MSGEAWQIREVENFTGDAMAGSFVIIVPVVFATLSPDWRMFRVRHHNRPARSEETDVVLGRRQIDCVITPTETNNMLTLLFDIDGTLVRAGGAGLMAMKQAMKDLHDIDQLPDVTVHGRTDHSIVSDLFAPLPIEVDQARDAFTNRYCELLQQTLPKCDGHVLPNVVELLEYLSRREDVSLGLLTGNMKRASDAKMDYFKLNHHFAYGGFGDAHPHRNDVARIAKEAAANHLGDRFIEGNVWVIGDTVNDITCARSIGAKVVAVETGGGSRAELVASDPDLIYQTLPEPSSFLERLLG